MTTDIRNAHCDKRGRAIHGETHQPERMINYTDHVTRLMEDIVSRVPNANLVVLPAEHALDFMRFCVRNPKPCPLLEVTDAGSPYPVILAADADLRTDVPRYRVFRDGKLIDEPTDVTRYWRADLVSFLLCL